MSWPPHWKPSMTSGSRSALAAYSAAVYPAGPPPMMINSRVFTSGLRVVNAIDRSDVPGGGPACGELLNRSTANCGRPGAPVRRRSAEPAVPTQEDRDMKKIAVLYLTVALLAFGTG